MVRFYIVVPDVFRHPTLRQGVVRLRPLKAPTNDPLCDGSERTCGGCRQKAGRKDACEEQRGASGGNEKHKWEFRARFRRHAFGWRSQPAITRIKQAVSEIKKVAKKNPMLAAEGAIGFLECVSPAIENVDSSSGAIGAAVNKAIAELVPIIATAPADVKTRDRWLERLWEAHQTDEIPYIERLGDYWGELCASKETASGWAERAQLVIVNVRSRTRTRASRAAPGRDHEAPQRRGRLPGRDRFSRQQAADYGVLADLVDPRDPGKKAVARVKRATRQRHS